MAIHAAEPSQPVLLIADADLFDLRRVAVVHNLHVIARQPTADGYQLAG